ncbi:hypothetical protein [Streptomyces sp. NPDC058657]|uniref:hypothetical protein n=1 Tax=unclassified Streptomyces TaxID=2593676 RepID=UPI003660EDC4
MRSAGVAAAAVLCGGLLLTGCGATGTATGGPSSAGTSAASPRDSTPSGTGLPSTGAPSGTAQPGDGTPSPTAPPVTGDPAPSTSVPGKGQQLVAATVSGGIDGRHRSVVVSTEGTYTTTDRKKGSGRGRMSPAELAELRTALAESGFAKLPRVSKADPPVMDGITTAVVHQGHEVTTDGMKKIPKLDRIIAALPGLG